MSNRRSNVERSRQTRHRLLTEGRRLFADNGYAAVGLTEVTDGTGLTKGALYHHFDGKAGLFRAVVAQVQDEVGQRVAAASETETDPWLRFTAGCRAFLEAGCDPEVRQIMLVDGPAVLGWSEWRDMDDASSARHLADALSGLIGAGVITPQPVAPLVHLLSGAMNEAALWLAGSATPDDDLSATVAALSQLLGALRTAP
ncbi:TetR/AcrR family transcriptional regulator [Nocardiopsis ansamitocini]|uniref:TetR family transcriptional regulator n=1 Tax=Nocardiopsis ansamitocini TaxID=1670832 RepID=A0A9W6P2Z4_9ACTN|nr:TetR/AcrR family transcriptional regulator [Nocardiopsis ansamitocini]GLU46073.1 TetR family transcriptional regulator [Nocardiopsis ansamitocini]